MSEKRVMQQTFGSSFSAVSKPIFRAKTRLETLFGIYKMYALLHLSKLSSFAKINANYVAKKMCHKVCQRILRNDASSDRDTYTL